VIVAGWVLLGLLCAAAIVLVAIGAIVLVKAQRGLAQSSKRRETSVAALAAEAKRLQTALERFGRMSDAVDALAARAKVALAGVRDGLKVFVLGEAVAALRGTAASVSALEELF